MKTALYLALFVVMLSMCSQNASATCYCWIDAKTGEEVPTVPESGVNHGAATIQGAGAAEIDPLEPNRAHNAKTGQTFVRLPNKHCWIDAKTGKEVPTVPESGVNHGAATIQGAGAAEIDPLEPNRAHNAKTGQTFVRVPCPEPATSTAAGGAGVAPQTTPAAIFTGFYVGVNGNASFALPASQSLTFNTDGHSDSEASKTRSAVGGGVNLLVGYDFTPFKVGPVTVQPVTVMNFTYTNVDVRTSYGANSLHFDQNLYNLGVDGRLRFPNCSPFTPFVEGGFGLGISEGSFRLYGPGTNSFLGHATALAPVAQLGTGVDYKLNGSWSLYLEGTAQIPLNDYDYRMTHVSSLGGGDASITTTTPIDLGIGFGAKYNF